MLKYGLYGLVLVIIVLALTGKLHPLGAVIAATIPFLKGMASWLIRLMPAIQWFRKQRFANPVMTTRFLRIVVDPSNGKITGEVLAGSFTGSPLAQLSQQQLEQLLGEYQQQDPESAQLLRAYYQQRFEQQSQQSKQHSHQSNTANNGQMTRDEALQILGLDEKATNKDITMAHRRLMQKLHPDRGGNHYLAAKINQAKDCLLKT